MAKEPATVAKSGYEIEGDIGKARSGEDFQVDVSGMATPSRDWMMKMGDSVSLK